MLQFYTERSLFPEKCQLVRHPKDWFDIFMRGKKEVFLSGVVKEALWEIERSTVDEVTALPKNSLGDYFSWNDLGSGLQNLVLQYYFCNGGIEELGGNCAIRASFCGSNIMSFMFLHSKWFDKVPIYLDCFNFALNPSTEPLNGEDCGYCDNEEYRKFFEEARCKINDYELSYQEAVDLMLCMKGGYHKSWAAQVTEKPELRYFDKYLDKESLLLLYEWDDILGAYADDKDEEGGYDE